MAAFIFGYGAFFHDEEYIPGTGLVSRGWPIGSTDMQPDPSGALVPVWDRGLSPTNFAVWLTMVGSIVVLFEWCRRRRWRFTLRTALAFFAAFALFHGLSPGALPAAVGATLKCDWEDALLLWVNAYVGPLGIFLAVLMLLAWIARAFASPW